MPKGTGLPEIIGEHHSIDRMPAHTTVHNGGRRHVHVVQVILAFSGLSTSSLFHDPCKDLPIISREGLHHATHYRSYINYL
jgi:hypothetical protein